MSKPLVSQPDSPLERHACILETLAIAQTGLTLTQIANATGLQVGAVHRLVNSLRSAGFVANLDSTKNYVLGPRLLRLFHLSMTPPSLIKLAEGELHKLVTAFGETAFLAKLEGAVVESVAMETPQEDHKAFVQPGRVMPMHAAASAKVILAFQSESVIDQMLSQPLTKFTADTKIDADKIRLELAGIRQDRFAVCDNELDKGVLSFAAPIPMESGEVIYSIGISGLADRLRSFSTADIRGRLIIASNSLSELLRQQH